MIARTGGFPHPIAGQVIALSEWESSRALKRRQREMNPVFAGRADSLRWSSD
jgi:hypothetical protein